MENKLIEFKTKHIQRKSGIDIEGSKDSEYFMDQPVSSESSEKSPVKVKKRKKSVFLNPAGKKEAPSKQEIAKKRRKSSISKRSPHRIVTKKHK